MLAHMHIQCAALRQAVVEAYAVLLQRFGSPVHAGRNRIVFVGRRVVAKLPRTDDGAHDNIAEALLYRRPRRPFPLATCRLVHVADAPVLLMQRLQTGFARAALPDWADWVDCAQVGQDARGHFLAYDYA